jgi:peptide/nickel transport system substrate-binding protein
MFSSKKLMLVFGVLIIASMVLAACGGQPVVETVVVTEVVEVAGTPQVVEKVITATPAPEVEAPPAMEEGPIMAEEGLIPCNPIPEMAFDSSGPQMVSLRSPVEIASVPQTLLAKPVLAPVQQAGDVYKVGVFEDVTTTNFWAANGPDNTVWNSYMLAPPMFMYEQTAKYFTFVPSAASVATPDPLTEEGDFWVTEIPIRQDITWSDGEPFTAADVAFTANAVVDLGLIGGNWQSWYDANYLDHLEAVDDYTVKYFYHTKPGLGRHEYGTLQAPILAEHYWAPYVEEAMAPINELAADASEEDAIAAQAAAHDILYAVVPDGEPTAGSYLFQGWEPGAFLENSANPDWFQSGMTIEQWPDAAYRDSEGLVVGTPEGEAETTYTRGPNAASAIYTIYGSQDAAILALKDGEVDFVINPLGLQRGLADQIRNDANLTVIENSVNGFRYMSFNNRRRPMNDCAFRQAVAVLIDKEFVTQTILQGAAFPFYSFVAEGNAAWYNPDISKLGEGLTREERTNLAVAILEQAGFSWEGDVKPTWDEENRQVTQAGRLLMPDGTPVPTLNMPAPSPGYDPLRSTFAIWIETWLNEFGIPLEAQLAGFNVIVPIIFTEQDFDMYILGWSLDIFPTSLLDFFSEEQAAQDGNNAGGYVNPEFEASASALLTCDTLESCREEAFKAQAILSEELPYVVLFDTGIIEAYRSASVDYPFTDTLSGLQYAHQQGAIQDAVTLK